MSVATETQKPDDGTKLKKWLVRNEKGETFGPVDLETLRSWACDGRLAPTNEVSGNGTDWLLATAQRALAMDWVAEVTPGTFYGPIHKAAMEELIKDGSIASESAFFARHGIKASQELSQSTQQVAELAQARQQASAFEAQARAAQEQASVRTTELAQARRQAAEAEARARAAQEQASVRAAELTQARQQASAFEAQARAAQEQASVRTTELAQARRQAAEAEARALAAQEQASARAAELEQAHRQASAFEAQVRVAQEQASARAAELEQAHQQLEQAHSAQRQVAAQVSEQERQLALIRGEQSETVNRLAGLRAEWAAKEQAFEAELQSLRVVVAQTTTETAAQGSRVGHLEAALAEAGRAVQQGQAAQAQVKELRSELDQVRSALDVERQRVQQSHARCATVSEALEGEGRRISDQVEQVAALRTELALERRKVDDLRVALTRAEGVSKTQPEPVRVVETLIAEPMEATPRQAPRPRPTGKTVVEAEVLPPEQPKTTERPRPPAEKPPAFSAPHAGHSKHGVSMADLEQQARRELERLGAQGASFFSKKR